MKHTSDIALPIDDLNVHSRGDRVFRISTAAMALMIPLLMLVLGAEMLKAAWPVFKQAGMSLVVSSDWSPPEGKYGAAPAIYGTVVSSLIALVIATPLAIGTAIFVSELAPGWLRQPVVFLVDLLAAVPSVVYGLWGIFVLLPFLRSTLIPFLTDTMGLGNIVLFRGPAYGPSLLAAGLILAIMILPYISSVVREVLGAVPRSQREAAMALGATKWETIRDAVLPSAKSGIAGGVVLGLGRALGETMAVTMLIGNRHEINASLLAPGYSMSSLIANEFPEASDDMHMGALMAVAVMLLVIALIVNGIARWLVRGAAAKVES